MEKSSKGLIYRNLNFPAAKAIPHAKNSIFWLVYCTVQNQFKFHNLSFSISSNYNPENHCIAQLNSTNGIVLFRIATQLVEVHERRQFNVALEDILLNPVSWLTQATLNLIACANTEYSVQLF